MKCVVFWHKSGRKFVNYHYGNKNVGKKHPCKAWCSRHKRKDLMFIQIKIVESTASDDQGEGKTWIYTALIHPLFLAASCECCAVYTNATPYSKLTYSLSAFYFQWFIWFSGKCLNREKRYVDCPSAIRSVFYPTRSVHSVHALDDAL